MEFSVMTYNIHLGLDSDLDTLAGIIGEADVVALQEVGNDWFEGEPGHQAQQLAKLSGLNHFRFASALTVRPGTDPPEAHPAPTADDRPGFGVALLSRFPLGPWTRHRLPKRQDIQRCILSGTVVTPSGPVTVMVTQLSTSQKDRMVQGGALVRHAQTQASPLMVLGDFNAAPLSPELEGINAFLRNAGGDDPPPSYPADDPADSIDHIFISSEMSVVAASSPVPFPGSNHFPVMARLSL
ncbi:MAG: endonuclease/exonuclease/phosphatase family protein [Myxococcota bacterium]|nr:endonuclease/exonuclease/phosphatase family protein [Myxococcota bacterium]MEE2780245.1 endonuclease/exonuclease/phosphatase family protein [Myxococcota bacterium]